MDYPRTIKARDIAIGDMLDLENDADAHRIMTEVDIHAAEFELCTVCEIEVMADCIRIGFEGIGGLAAYDLDRPVTLEGHDDRYVEV